MFNPSRKLTICEVGEHVGRVTAELGVIEAQIWPKRPLSSIAAAHILVNPAKRRAPNGQKQSFEAAKKRNRAEGGSLGCPCG